MASLRQKVEAELDFGFDLDPQRLAPLVRDIGVVDARFKKEVKRFLRVKGTKV